MIELIQQRLNNYFLNEDKNPFNLVMLSIINNPDSFVCEFYKDILNESHKFLLADIFSMAYLSIRNIYDLPYLNNIQYRDKKPTSVSLYGESISILGSVSLIIEITNELLKVVPKHYPKLIEIFPDIVISLNNIIINPFNKNNMEIIKNNMLIEYNGILKRLS
jgi:hypothetical protein